MPYPVDHDTRNRLSAVPMIVSPLQTRGVGTRFLPESAWTGGRTECGQTGWESVSGERKGDVTYIDSLRCEGASRTRT